MDFILPAVSMNAQAVGPGFVTQSRFGIKEILVPTDLTKYSRSVIGYAMSLGRIFGAHLTLLHVYQEPYSVDYLRGPQTCDAVIKHRRGAEAALAALAAEVRENRVACSSEFRYGAFCEEIEKAAENRDLIVISTHQYGWLGRLAYGCDAKRILHHTHCPILIVSEACIE
jgi:nucleotide-binding universal stress UspA family protein